MAVPVSRCLVYCRLRPDNSKDYEDGGYQLVSLDKKRVAVKDERHYDFDGTFGADSLQEDVFDVIAVPCLTHAVNGFCSALMCYGQTGTGKSFTMCCTKPGFEGIIPRSAKYLFDLIKRDASKAYTVTGQFIQIYRDQLGDLMTEGGRDKVDIHFEKDEGVTLTGCSSHVLTNESEFMQFYDSGNSRRVVTATAMNPESSRGHSAMIIVIESRDVNDDTAPKMKGKITFIDLAGYERFSKTGISNSNPIMKDEAKTINASLLSLGHVVSALSNGDKHIPWRNAKLTRLLQDSIGGRSRTSIVLTIGPSSESLHETTNSLQFGQRAMAVKVSAKVNVTTDYEKLAAKLQSMLDERDERINLLEVQIRSRDAERAEISERYQRDEDELRERFRKEFEELRLKGGSVEQLRKVEDVFQVEVENLKEQQLEEVQYQEEAHNRQIVTLAAEQQRRERKRQAELQITQERMIAEFEKRISSSEGNDELVDALKQLSERDALLASRATTVADLQERVGELSSLLERAGIRVPEFEPLEESFIDLTQLDEIKKRFEEEIEHHKTNFLSLRVQLETTMEQLDARATEVVKLHGEVDRLQKQLDDAGLCGEAASSPLLAPRGFVDTESLESMRVIMQEEIDRLTSANKGLKAELEIALAAATTIEPSAPAAPATPRIGRPRGMSRADAGRAISRRSDPDSEKDRRVLQERVSDMEKRLVNLSREYNLALKQNDTLRELCGANGIAIEETHDALPDREASGRMYDALLAVKDDEAKSLLDVIRRQEESAMADMQTRQRLEEDVTALKDRLGEAGILVPEVPPRASVDHHQGALDALLRFVSDSRSATTSIVSLGASKCPEEERAHINEILQAKDDMLMLRESVIVEKEIVSGKLASVVFLLKGKLEGLGASVSLSGDLQSALSVAEGMHNAAVAQATRQIEEDLHRQREEKEKLQSVLQTMSAERSKDSQLIANVKQDLERKAAASRELESNLSKQREEILSASVGTQSLMGTVVDLKQQLLDKEAELGRITQELMKLQAEKGSSESESIFSVVKRKLRE